MLRRFLVGRHNGGALYVYANASNSARRHQSSSQKLSGFYNAGGTSPWFVYFQTTPNDDCMKFVIEGHEFLANMMPEDSAIYKAEQRRLNPPKAAARAPFVVARRERLVAEAEEKRRAAEFAAQQKLEAEADAAAAAANAPSATSSSGPTVVRTLVDLPSEEPYIDEDGVGGQSHHEMQAPNTPEADALAAAELARLEQAEAEAAATSQKKKEADDAAHASGASTPASPKSPSVEQRVAPMTMTFDRDNGYLSPLANALLENVPDLIEDVTIGHHFITIRRTRLDELKWKYYDDDIEGERLLKEEEEKKRVKREAAAAVNSSLNPSSSSSSAAAAADVNPRMSPFEVAETMAEITNACALPAQLHAAGNNAGSAALKAERTDYSADEEEALSVEGIEEGDSDKSAAAAASGLDPESEEVFRANYCPDRLKRVIPIAEAQLNWTDLQLQISAILTDHMYSRKPHVTPDAPHPHADTLPKAGDSEALLAIKELIAGTIRPLVQEDGGDLRLVKFEPITADEARRVAAANRGMPYEASTTNSSQSSSSATAAAGEDDGSCARAELPAAVVASSSSAAGGGGGEVEPFQSGRLHIEMLGACKSCKSSKTTLKDMIERTLQHWVPEVAEVVEVNMARKASALGRSQK